MGKQFKYIDNKDSSKLNLDQYYTDIKDSKYCIDKTLKILSDKGFVVSDFLEPSAGTGSFSDYLIQLYENVVSIDIEPKREYIIEQDYLKYDIGYKQNRLIIGNPPFGSKMSLAQNFYKKSILIGDYISFLLPISQLDNNQSLFEFDLLYSEDMGEMIFSGERKVHCCFNIYVRPINGLNKKISTKLNDITISRQDSKNYTDFDFDIRMCYWGDATAGKILSVGENYSAEYKIKINNPLLKEKIFNVLNTVKWRDELNCTAMLKIQQFHITSVLKKFIPEIS